MRKLSQSELQAMACKVYDNLEKQAKLEQDKLNAIQDRENKKLLEQRIADAKVVSDTIKKLPKKNRDAMFGFLDTSAIRKLMQIDNAKTIDMKTKIAHMRKEQITVTLPDNPRWSHRFSSQLYNDMTIAQIDSDNVDDLLNKVASRYIKRPSTGVTK